MESSRASALSPGPVAMPGVVLREKPIVCLQCSCSWNGCLRSRHLAHAAGKTIVFWSVQYCLKGWAHHAIAVFWSQLTAGVGARGWNSVCWATGSSMPCSISQHTEEFQLSQWVLCKAGKKNSLGFQKGLFPFMVVSAHSHVTCRYLQVDSLKPAKEVTNKPAAHKWQVGGG